MPAILAGSRCLNRRQSIISIIDRRGLGGSVTPRRITVIIEHHPDGFVAYPVGLRGVVVGEGDTAEEALSDVQSAIRFHIETFGEEAWESQNPVLDVQLRQASV